MSSSSASPRCGYIEESFLHCVRDGPPSKNLWLSFGFTDPQFFDPTDNILDQIWSDFGGVFRNSDGVWISGFYGFIVGSIDILYAELLAIYHGLSLAKDLGHGHIACYSDSLNSLNLIQYATPRFHIYAMLIQNIKDLLLGFGTTTLIHSLWEGNSCAGFMAKLDASSNVEVLIHSFPPPGASGSAYS
ncbi:ribonuclease H protein [Trifolium medium]|uniref:Ribonuclease H protein n=1 Tax=Trifolium medium TaxID=97028 RepID=A0A392LYM0_9FABA|nr:ribonuclease H protein [Trifolium medium]